jgi:hypothetical protein
MKSVLISGLVVLALATHIRAALTPPMASGVLALASIPGGAMGRSTCASGRTTAPQGITARFTCSVMQPRPTQSPRQIPRSRAVSTVSPSSGTSFIRRVA